MDPDRGNLPFYAHEQSKTAAGWRRVFGRLVYLAIMFRSRNIGPPGPLYLLVADSHNAMTR